MRGMSLTSYNSWTLTYRKITCDGNLDFEVYIRPDGDMFHKPRDLMYPHIDGNLNYWTVKLPSNSTKGTVPYTCGNLHTWRVWHSIDMTGD